MAPALEILICILVLGLTTLLLVRNVHPVSVLLMMGLLMLAVSVATGTSDVPLAQPTGSTFFDIFRFIEEKFAGSLVKLGFMIMSIGGYVALMNCIKATDAMVYIASKPLSFLRGKPYLAACLSIPIGMLLYLTIPSASGLGLLLVSTVYPILVSLGVSKLTAISVISAATVFDMGPGSANTLNAATLVGMDHIEYFVSFQLRHIIPTTLLLLVVYYFVNRYFDKKDLAAGKKIYDDAAGKCVKPDVPLYYAVFPVLPLVLLIVFSKYFGLFDVNITTTVAMLVCVVLTALALLIRSRRLKETFAILKSFWDGMGSVFSSVVALIVAAEVFAAGLNSLHFIDLLVKGTSSVGLGAGAVTIMMMAVIFLSAIIMGSGNAAFFSFGPLIPGIASSFGASATQMILPIQLCAGMGRGASPIAAVNVAIAGAVGVSPMELAKRNMIPMSAGCLFLILLNYIC